MTCHKAVFGDAEMTQTKLHVGDAGVVTVIGHPFSSVGMGEQMRSCLKSLLKAVVPVEALDIYKYALRTDPDHVATVTEFERNTLRPGGIRIFHINGNEVTGVLERLRSCGFDFNSGYNIIMPAWELPKYPDEWAVLLKKFDEVWSISRFVESSLSKSNVSSTYIGQSIEVEYRPFLPRKYFGIRESAFVYLNFFDTTSFVARKNPSATIEFYNKLRNQRPYDDIQLVLKVKNGDAAAPEWRKELEESVPNAVVLTDNLRTYETHSLIAACDCLISLHRSEGFGRGTGEAMSLGKLGLATGWSGNLDYMTGTNSLLVDHALVPVTEGQYPHWQNQVWAEPDVDHAVFLAARALDDPGAARAVRRAGRMTVCRTASYRAVGLRMLERIEAIQNETQQELQSTNWETTPKGRRAA